MNETYPEDMIERLEFSESDETVRISMKDISGKNMYCTDEAYDEIRSRLSGQTSPEKGLHYIDTGNYHYMSRIFSSFISEKYDLILIDNHNDMQRAGLGDILSCGSWALDVLEKDDNLSSLYVYGPAAYEVSGEECDILLGGKTVTGRVYRGRGYEEGSHPIYLSVDKDALDVTECITNWDQGNLKLEEMACLTDMLLDGKRLIGADICGGISETDPECTEEVIYDNLQSDGFLLREFRKYFKE